MIIRDKVLIFWESAGHFGRMITKTQTTKEVATYHVYVYDLNHPKHRVLEHTSCYYGDCFEFLVDACEQGLYPFSYKDLFEGKVTARLKESIYEERNKV